MTSTTITTAGPTDFASFVDLLEDELGCRVRDRRPDALLHEDLGWDSLSFFELIGLFDRRGLALPEELLAALRTLGDVHHYFGTIAATESGGIALSGTVPVLEVPTQRDFDYLFQLHATGDHLVHYRLRAMTPSPDSFHRLLWEGVTAQFLVRTDSGAAAGLVSCFGADFRNRHAHIGVVADPEWHDSGVLVAGAWRFIGYLFEQFDLRKLYAEVLSSNFHRLATGTGRLFTIEGRLTNHEFVAGHYEDLFVLALDRERWLEQQHRIAWRADA